MVNAYGGFRELVDDQSLQIGLVISHNTDGTSTLQLIDGGLISARGQDVAVSAQAFVRGGVVEGPAPALPLQLIDV